MVDEEYLQKLARACDVLIENPDSPSGNEAREELSRLLNEPHHMQSIIAKARIGHNVGKIENKTGVGISVLCNCDYEPSFLVSLKACVWRMVNSLFPMRKNSKIYLENWLQAATAGETVEYGGRRIRRRPRVLDYAVKEDIFEAIKPDIISLFTIEVERSDLDAQYLAAIKKAFLRHYDMDGCRTVWAIETEGICVATWGFAEIIETAPYDLILKRHVRKWIEEENVSPLYCKGQFVVWSRGEGVIDEAWDKYSPGCYVIRRTDIAMEDPSRREIVPWEECRLVGEV